MDFDFASIFYDEFDLDDCYHVMMMTTDFYAYDFYFAYAIYDFFYDFGEILMKLSL